MHFHTPGSQHWHEKTAPVPSFLPLGSHCVVQLVLISQSSGVLPGTEIMGVHHCTLLELTLITTGRFFSVLLYHLYPLLCAGRVAPFTLSEPL
jgi:hypothetical protein